MTFFYYFNYLLFGIGVINTIFLLIFAPQRRNIINILTILEYGFYAPYYLIYELPLRILLRKIGNLIS